MRVKGRLSRLLSLLLAVLAITGMLPGTVRAAGRLPEFADIRGHWAETDIRSAVASGWVNGYPDGTFRPNRTVTRAEFVKMLVVAMGLPTSASEFKDGRLEDLYELNADRHWLKEAGYLRGAVAAHLVEPADYTLRYDRLARVAAWSLEPDKPLTRLEATILADRAVGLQYDAESAHYSRGWPGIVEPALPFADAAAVPSWAKGWVAVASQRNIVRGDTDGAFHSDRTLTRAEAVAMLQRVRATPVQSRNLTRWMTPAGDSLQRLPYLADRTLSVPLTLTFQADPEWGTFEILAAWHHLDPVLRKEALGHEAAAFWDDLQRRDLGSATLDRVIVTLEFSGTTATEVIYDGKTMEYHDGYFNPGALEPDPNIEAVLLDRIIVSPDDTSEYFIARRVAEVARNLDELGAFTATESYLLPYPYASEALALPETALSDWGLAKARALYGRAKEQAEELGGHLDAVALQISLRDIPVERPSDGLNLDSTFRANPLVELVYDGTNLRIKRPSSIAAWAAAVRPDYHHAGGDGAVWEGSVPSPQAVPFYLTTFLYTLGVTPYEDLPFTPATFEPQAPAGDPLVWWQRLPADPDPTGKEVLGVVVRNPRPGRGLKLIRMLREGDDVVVVVETDPAGPPADFVTVEGELSVATRHPVGSWVLIDADGTEYWHGPIAGW